jgi:hypothetical protein
MPKPYHTPKSERDEKVGALSEREQGADRLINIIAGFKKDGEDGFFHHKDDEDPQALVEWIIDEAREALEWQRARTA